ncbi:putative quinol monooxygenase [Hirschia baltica]|uniref:Antibiotic biosynthesis monooxygenase n=1 Tax=Hirschia baltica (strain ATCC 49814 / DSM 5838 / IFAM 1418) TaxID=582402 RepID=C6XMD8_HIRBI|nr:putative quinol monooxygenase [Hirschia baltica]ACT58081.1 Antibiotic biosynthesis monooxygenase [Hirschia baltica ATCC 49814]
MYGLIGKITAVAGKSDELASILVEGTKNMPGCVSYTIAKCTEESDLLWITEVWLDKSNHEASLQLPAVQAAIGKGRPLIAGMERVATTNPVE